MQQKSPQREATLDQDASLIATYKAEALYGYLGDKTYQPMTTYWVEQDMVVHSEFRDGNVPANYQNLRALKETLSALPEGVVKVYFRGDTAANQKELLRYCAQGTSDRFGVIEFAVGVDVTAEFKRAVTEVAEGEWQPLEREVDGQRVKTGQEWAEACFVPNWTAQRKEGPTYRYIVTPEKVPFPLSDYPLACSSGLLFSFQVYLIPSCNQVDSIVKYCHGGDPWQERRVSLLRK